MVSDLDEAAEVTVYPQFSDDGGLESERTYVKQLVQKYISDGSSEDLFNEEEIDDADMELIFPYVGGSINLVLTGVGFNSFLRPPKINIKG